VADVVNNVNVGAARDFVEQARKDPAVARKKKSVEGIWTFKEGQPQMGAELEFPKGKTAVLCELPAFAGGWGTSPDPIQYCLFGMAACYGTTFAGAASQEGVTLTSLRVRAENEMDLRKQLGLGKDPIIQRVKFTVHAEGAPKEVLERIKRLADERCPGVECVTRSIPLETLLA